ncbi:MAG TPA: class I SAM-dependent methyltransferase [Syntrophomonadaceae bacterium]|nr:class I SAM-dependent methyltransferase [Syntrophomonadaceae bacterium]HNX28973.1 class I SAM-dependent methyltransferase [Syntrophomonadaceae bacterium]HPR93729.1 class I SAM-dependent methyltransferase [Syntrophomonadaceae bacterium]
MILRDFFSYYFKVTDPEVHKIYQELLPESTELAADYEGMFARNDEEAIAFLLKFHNAANDLRRNRPEQAILFNVHGNICFPFFVEYIWKVMNNEEKVKVLKEAQCDNLTDLTEALNDRVELRNWFRKEIGSSLSQEDLFTMNEIIALQNFSSGGEYSFLRYAYPTIKKVRGKVLDAGCGAGFASLVMSQYMTVYSIDACRARLERGMALSRMMKKGDKEIFPKVIKLIEEELGDMAVKCEFPSAEKLLSEPAREITFTEGSLDALDYPDNFFDAINCLDVLEHTYDPEKIVEQFARVLKPGGKVFITAPTRYGEVEQRIHESIEGTMFPAMLHMHHFDPGTLNKLFSAHGLKEVEMLPFDYMSWDEFLQIADRSPAKELAEELRKNPFDEVALQLYAVYEKI